jgi:hypothetical protein
MKRVAAILALTLAAAVPLGASAAKTTTGKSAASVKCASGDPVVWVNTDSKVYHMAGTRYYGKTKHGQYACKSTAESMGDHPASMTSGTSGAGGTMSTKSGKMKKSKSGGTMPMASPSPY